MELVSLKQLCDELTVSVETGRNWIRLGKLTPQRMEGKNPLFAREYVERLKREIRSGDNRALKSRRNKKFISGNAVYRDYVAEGSGNPEVVEKLLDSVARHRIGLTDRMQRLLLAECGIQLLLDKMRMMDQSGTMAQRAADRMDTADRKAGSLERYLTDQIPQLRYRSLIDDLTGLGSAGREEALRTIRENPFLFEAEYCYVDGEDTLGLLYLSCRNLAERKATGSYYTPAKTVRQLTEKLCPKPDAGSRVLDPCCGTGNFLLQLPEGFDIRNLYGNDLDKTGVQIARLNLALKYSPETADILYENITDQDYLRDYRASGFDYILGNPPWGYQFSEKEKEYLRAHFRSAAGRNPESCALFIERALGQLSERGAVSFVLPEAILHVRSHLPIREEILRQSSVTYLAYLGNVFDGVQCPCVILQMERGGQTDNATAAVGTDAACLAACGTDAASPTATACDPDVAGGTLVYDGQREYRISRDRQITAQAFSFRCTDEEQAVLDKIERGGERAYLENAAIFALGIVTGDNKRLLSHQKTDRYEPILRGTDIRKYRISEPEQYILFDPASFQQTAPEQYYRAPEKLLYRFIGSRLVFAYDDRQTLSLNSCNLVIPQVEGLRIKYILTVLNSRVAQYVFQKRFHSVKVLRSHLEKIPLPVIGCREQAALEAYADALADEKEEKKRRILMEELDKKIADLFRLTEAEYALVKEAVGREW